MQAGKIFSVRTTHFQDTSSNLPDSRCSMPVCKWAGLGVQPQGQPGSENRIRPGGPVQKHLVSSKLYLVYLFIKSRATGGFLPLFINNYT